jgi:lysophospholipase L1-like esterase
LETWLPPCGNGPNPNYILLMIGTNDVAFQYFLNGPKNNGMNSIEMRLDQLITQISTPDGGLRPNAHLIVASILNTTDSGNRHNYADFAAAVPGIVAAHAARGENVSYVDMFDALDPSTDFADYEHPDVEGYAKMAQVWYDGIVAAAGAGATPTAPEPDGMEMMAAAGVAVVGMSLRRPVGRRGVDA